MLVPKPLNPSLMRTQDKRGVSACESSAVEEKDGYGNWLLKKTTYLFRVLYLLMRLEKEKCDLATIKLLEHVWNVERSGRAAKREVTGNSRPSPGLPIGYHATNSFVLQDG